MIKKPTQLVASALGNHVNNQLRYSAYFWNCEEIANSQTADNSPDRPATSSGLLERQANTKDQGVTNIAFTRSGKVVLKDGKALLRANITRRLSLLSYKELEGLSLSLVESRDVGSGLQ